MAEEHLPGAVRHVGEAEASTALVIPTLDLTADSAASLSAPQPPMRGKAPPRLAPGGTAPSLYAMAEEGQEFSGVPLAPSSAATSVGPPVLDEERVTLKKLEEFLAIESGMRRSCRTLPLTIFLWIFFVLLVFHHGQALASFESARGIEAAVREIVAIPRNGTAGDGLNLEDLGELHEILLWAEDGLVPKLSSGAGIHMQQLIGIVRVTQVRGENTTCDLSSDLRNFHDGGCHPSGGTPGSYHRAEQGDFAFVPQETDPNRFVAWLEIGRSEDIVRSRVAALREFRWLGLATQEVIFDALFLNAEVHIYSHLTVRFQLHRTGWLEKEVFVEPLRGDVYTHWGLIFFDIVWLALMLGLLQGSATTLYNAYDRGLLRLYVRDVFNVCDWITLSLGCEMAIYFVALVLSLDTFTQNVASLSDMPLYSVAEASAVNQVLAVIENDYFQVEVRDLLDACSLLTTQTTWHRLGIFLFSLLLVLRFFRGFAGQPRIAVLVQTLLVSADYLIHYAVVFFTVFGGFAISGYILFGEQLAGWSTIGMSVSRLFLVLMGRFHYDELHEVAPVSAGFWFFAFYLSVGLLLTSFLTAAILHGYLDVRSRIGEPGVALSEQVRSYVTDVWWSRTYEGSRKSAPDEELLKLLYNQSDPVEEERIYWLGKLLVDRRLRRREDLEATEQDPAVDLDFLENRGCDRDTAEHLLERCSKALRRVSTSQDPNHRLMLTVVRQIALLKREADRNSEKGDARADWTERAVDRVELKHAKCVALARRARRAQDIDAHPGWSAHMTADGRRILRHDATGLTSYTLPRALV